MYINYLSSIVNSTENSNIRLFSNDTAIYREINDDTDAEILSSDLNNFKLRCMEFKLNLCECTVKYFLQKSPQQQHTVTDNGIHINTSDEVKDLGSYVLNVY
jgi:hypothetical protein